MNDKDYVTLKLEVKPYVWRYMMNHYGMSGRMQNAIRLPNGDEVYKIIRRCLTKPNHQFDKRTKYFVHRSKTLHIALIERDVTLSGWDLSPTDAATIARIIERRIQEEMLVWVGIRYMMNGILQECCLTWLEKEEMDILDWSLEAMIRLCSRRKLYELRESYKSFMDGQIDQIIMRAKFKRKCSCSN